MKEVKLRMKELNKYKIIKELVDHNGNKERAALKLGITRRQVDRLIIKYKETGKSGFVHGNRGKCPSTTLDRSISDTIILLYKNKYQDFNFKHFHEYLINEEKIEVSYKFVYDTLTKAEILSPKARRRTKKEFKKKQLMKEKKINLAMPDEQIETIVNHELALEDAHPRGEKPKYFGELIEMDGSIHLWFGEKKCCLHLAVDKATNTVVGAWFDNQETLNGYYQIFNQILIKYGIPYKFLTDNRTVFNYRYLNKDKRTSDKDVLTQFGYACKQLGVALETTSVSQAKGLIERDNGTFQGRLVNELRLNGISTIEQANEYLTNVFVPKFNNNFAMDYTKFQSVFEIAPSEEKINYTLAILTARKIDNGNAIKYKNEYYQPFLDGQIKCFLPKTECLVINSFNGELLVSIDDKIYELKKLSRNAKISKEIDIIDTSISEIKEVKKILPPPEHKWKVSEFKYHIKRAHTNHQYA